MSTETPIHSAETSIQSTETPIQSISELAAAIKRHMETGFADIRVRGELGRVVRASSGHIYMDLKDEKAVLSAVLWKQKAAKIGMEPEQGLEVIVEGRLTTFAMRSTYQIVIETIRHAGAGALMAQLEARKRRLAGEGLFDSARKASLPPYPRHIGVVSAPKGAVIRDILHRLQARFPLRVTLWPSLVQGKKAADEIVAAIDGFAALPVKAHSGPERPDILIIARGGGSLEDLWCFNEEKVVRAIARCPIPTISAIGHETDWTLADLAASLRAPTPSAAAEIATPERDHLLAMLAMRANQAQKALKRRLDTNTQQLLRYKQALDYRLQGILQIFQRFDLADERFTAQLRKCFTQHAQALSHVKARLSGKQPLYVMLALACAQTEEKRKRLAHAMRHRLENAQQAHLHAASMLSSLSYLSVLERGYALLCDSNGRVLGRAAQAERQNLLHVHMHDARFLATPVSGRAAMRKTARRRQTTPSSRQPNLL